MRNILMTVMLLIVTALIFVNVIYDGSNGTKVLIEQKGTLANTAIEELNTE